MEKKVFKMSQNQREHHRKAAKQESYVSPPVFCHSHSDLLLDCKIVIEELANGQHVSPEGESFFQKEGGM